MKSYLFYMKYKQNSQFGGHFGRHLEFQYEESTSRLGTQAKKFARCIIVNIQPSNLFSGGGGTKLFFCPIGFCTTIYVQVTGCKGYQKFQFFHFFPTAKSKFGNLTLPLYRSRSTSGHHLNKL